MKLPMLAAHAAALESLVALGLLAPQELRAIAWLYAEPVLGDCRTRAESLHLHVKVDDTCALPMALLEALGARFDHGREGYVKLRFAGGLNAIFSHIPVAAEDLRECAAARRPRPFLDHLGFDLRSEDRETRAAFDALPAIAGRRGWPLVPQGGAGRPVKCCHSEVAEKHWLYVDGIAGMPHLPVEFAFGPLRHAAGMAGCDLRPARPGTEVAAAACCAAASG